MIKWCNGVKNTPSSYYVPMVKQIWCSGAENTYKFAWWNGENSGEMVYQ